MLQLVQVLNWCECVHVFCCMVVINQSNTIKMNVSDLKHSLVISLRVCVCVRVRACVCDLMTNSIVYIFCVSIGGKSASNSR